MIHPYLSYRPHLFLFYVDIYIYIYVDDIFNYEGLTQIQLKVCCTHLWADFTIKDMGPLHNTTIINTQQPRVCNVQSCTVKNLRELEERIFFFFFIFVLF
jgi:hypothetical protein